MALSPLFPMRPAFHSAPDRDPASRHSSMFRRTWVLLAGANVRRRGRWWSGFDAPALVLGLYLTWAGFTAKADTGR
jgi:hypothetical protein